MDFFPSLSPFSRQTFLKISYLWLSFYLLINSYWYFCLIKYKALHVREEIERNSNRIQSRFVHIEQQVQSSNFWIKSSPSLFFPLFYILLYTSCWRISCMKTVAVCGKIMFNIIQVHTPIPVSRISYHKKKRKKEKNECI